MSKLTNNITLVQTGLATLEQNLRTVLNLSDTFTPDTIQPGQACGTFVPRRRVFLEQDFVQYRCEIWLVAGFATHQEYVEGCVVWGESLAYYFESLRQNVPNGLYRIEFEDDQADFSFIASSRAGQQMAAWILDILTPCTLYFTVPRRYAMG